MNATASRAGGGETWMFRLYIAGQTPRSLVAIANLERLCAVYLPDRYHIDVIDLLLSPHLATDDQILAVPTLVRRHPPPLRKLIGDLSDTARVLQGLELRPR